MNYKPSEQLLRLIASLKDGKGQFIHAEWVSKPTPKAASKKEGIVLKKRTVAVVRTGVAYENLASVKNAIASGERGEVGELPWGEWAVYPYGIQNKGKEYVRLTLGSNTIPKCSYYVNEVEVDKAEFSKHLTESQQKPSEPTEVITVALENIVRLG